MMRDANRGMTRVIWIFVATIVFLVALGAVLWWFDGYWLTSNR